jgi:hypothetical protein
MLQESRTEEESQITLTGLAEFVKNATRIGGQIGLLGAAEVSGMVARVSRQIGLLESTSITETAIRSRETLAGLTGLATRAENWRFQSGC